MSFQGQFFRDFVRLSVYRYSGALLSFAASTVAARLLSPSDYGVVAMVGVFSSFLLMLLDSGISAAAIRGPADRSFHSQLQTMAVLIGMTACVTMWLLAIPICWFYRSPALLWPSIAMGFVAVAAALPIVPNAVLTKELRFREVGIGGLVGTAATIGLTLFLALMGLGHWALILPMVVSPVAQRLYLERHVPVGMGLAPPAEVYRAFRRNRALMGHMASFTMANYWARNADTLMAGRYYGDAATGIFSRAYTLLTLPLTLVTGVYNTVQFPSFQRLREEGRDLEGEYLTSLKILGFLVFPLVTLMLAMPKGLATALWGAPWAAVGDFLPFFGAVLSLQAMASTSGTLMVVAGRERDFAQLGVVNAGLMVGAIVLGVQFSLRHMVIAYTLTFTLLCVPLFLFFGLIKALGFSRRRALVSWGPDVLAAAAFVLDAGFNSARLSSMLLAALAVHRVLALVYWPARTAQT